MKRICAAILALINCVVLHAANPMPVVNSAAINYSTNQITISGTSFSPSGVAPTVAFNSSNLTLASFSNTTVIANLPAQQPGSYRLRVTSSNGNFYEFDVTYGAVGPQGPQGVMGPMG